MIVPYTQPLFEDLPPLTAQRRAQRVPLRQPEGRSAQYWSDQMLAAGVERARRDYCYAMMIAALLALDHSRGGH